MSIMEYNGGTIVAMTGKNCVGIAADRRCGLNQLQTISTHFEKIFPMTSKCLVGFQGLATDVQTLSELMQFKLKLYKLREDREMPTKVVSHLMGTTLYEKRFAPWFAEPIVAGLDKENNPYIAGFDFIGTESTAPDFVAAGTGTEQVFGVCESFWRPEMEPADLFETLSQCLLAGVDRDCLSGWGAVVHVLTPEGVTTKYLKTRMD